jgi:hypothetical protein
MVTPFTSEGTRYEYFRASSFEEALEKAQATSDLTHLFMRVHEPSQLIPTNPTNSLMMELKGT